MTDDNVEYLIKMCKKVIGYLILTSFFVFVWASFAIPLGFAKATFLFVTGVMMAVLICLAACWIVD